MLRAFLILSALIIIVSAQSSGKGFRTVIHSSFPIDAPLQFDPNNEERLVLSIVKPSSDVSLTPDDKHRLRIINIDHKLAQKSLSSNVKKTQSDSEVSVSARLTNRDELTQSKSTAETGILSKQPVIDYGLPKINLEDDISFAPSPVTKFVSQKLGSPDPKSSRLFVSKIPSAEELLEKGYVLTDIYPLEFTSDDSEFEFPTDRFFRLPPNNVDSQLRPPAKSFREFKSVLTSSLPQNKSESQPELQPKISSISTDEIPDVTVRPLEVKYNFLPKTSQAEFHLGKTYISKFLSPAVAYERPGTERESFDTRRTPSTIKNKQGISTQQPVKKENAEIASLTSKRIGEAVGSNTKTQEIPQTKYTLPSNDKDKKAFITSLFGDYTDEIRDVKSSEYQGPAANKKGALAGRISGTSGIESQTSSLLSSTSENSNDNSKFDIKTPTHRQELKEYSIPSTSSEESFLSSKLDEASGVKDVTSSSSAISNFQKQSIVQTQKVFSSKFDGVAAGEGIASSEFGNTKYVAESKPAGLIKPEKFAIYYKTPSSSLQGKYEIPKSYKYSRKPIRYVAVPKSDPEQFQSNIHLPYQTPNIKHLASFNAGEEKVSDFKSGSTIKSFEGFLKPEDFAIYYKTPSTQSGGNSESLSTRYGITRSYEYSPGDAKDQQTHSFLGVPSIPTSSYDLFEANLKTPSEIYGAPHIPAEVQSNSPVSSAYELPISNSDSIPTFLTASESKYSGNSEKVSIIYQSSSVKPACKLNITPPSTSYGIPSPNLSSNVDIRREPINKPFAEYGLPTVKPSSTTTESPGDNQHSDIDIRTISDSRVVVLKPSLDYGTPNVASTFTNIRTPSGRLSQMKQKFEKRTYEFGVPVLKTPNTRPLSSYEVPLY